MGPIARDWMLPALFVALTLLSLGTSLPIAKQGPTKSYYRVEPVEVSEAEAQLAKLAKNEIGRVLPTPEPAAPSAKAPVEDEQQLPVLVKFPPALPAKVKAGQPPMVPKSPVFAKISESNSQVPEPAGDQTRAEAAPPTEEPQGAENFDLGLDLTPKMVAQYLLITGDFAGFSAAMNDLLASQLIRPDDAQRYKDAVGEEYENLLSRLAYARDVYLQEMINGEVLPLEVRMRLASLGAQNDQIGSELTRNRLQSLLEKKIQLDQLLKSLMSEYLDQPGASKPAAAPQYNLYDTNEAEDLDQLINLMAEAVVGEDVGGTQSANSGQVGHSETNQGPPMGDIQLHQQQSGSGIQRPSQRSAFPRAQEFAQEEPFPVGSRTPEVVPPPAAEKDPREGLSENDAKSQQTGSDLNKEIPVPSSNDPLPTDEPLARAISPVLAGDRPPPVLGNIPSQLTINSASI